MKYCKQCKLNVIDSANRCPLCESVLESQTQNVEGEIENHSPKDTRYRYPDIEVNRTHFDLIKRIYLFLSIIIISTSIGVDLWKENGITWSILSTGAVLYAWTVIYHAIKNNVHVAAKIFVQAISGSIFIFLIDKVSGFDGWSVNYVIPQIFTLANVAIFVLMMINRMVWREFVFYELSMTLIGLIPIFLIMNDIVTRPLLSYICIVISAIILVGTMVFGDKTVKSELIRRFHV